MSYLDELQDDLWNAECRADELAEVLADVRAERDEVRAANAEWAAAAQDVADQRDEAQDAYDRLHTYTVGALRVYAREVQRLIAERDEARYGAAVWHKEAQDNAAERDSFYAQLGFANDTTEMLAEQLAKAVKEREAAHEGSAAEAIGWLLH